MKLRLALLFLLISALCHAYNFGQNKVNTTPEAWSTLQTMHFDVYFPRGENDFGRLAALLAEETYYNLRADLKYPISSRIPIIFYRSKSQFQSTNIIYPLLTEGVGGFTESLRNRVVIPFDGSYRNLEDLIAHELTHAYANALDKGMINSYLSLRPVSFPFWFSEGLPEFLSIGGENDYNNMFILDMVVNDYLVPLGSSDGYFAYRLGESFLAYIAKTYGREKVSEYYFTIHSSHNMDAATKKVFGIDFESLESRWRFQLKRDFYPRVNDHGVPQEAMEQRTRSDKDGSYFNFMPRFSPKGDRYVYFSTAGARYSVWMAGIHEMDRAKKIFTGEATGKAEEFYYFRSNLSWFPDGKRVAFSAKTSWGDQIHILDVDRGKIVQTVKLPEFDAIYELDVAPDGQKLVFAGQREMRCDIYLHDLETRQTRQLTDDYFNDAQPRFSPDGQTIVFSSERSLNPESQRKGFFANVVANIYSLDLDGGEPRQLTFRIRDCSWPMFDGSGDKLLYLTYEDKVNNLHALDLQSSAQAKVTDVLAGVFAADISPDNRYLLVSNYFDKAWNIYFAHDPLKNLAWSDSTAQQLSVPSPDLMAGVDLGQLDYFGKRKPAPLPRINPARQYDERFPLSGEYRPFELTREDSLFLTRDYSYDDRPTSKDNPPTIGGYKPRFSLDSIWGGLAYSSAVGTIGYVELGLSDIMGNHGIGANVGVAGKLEESNLLLTYMYLKHRMDYGVGIYNLVDDAYYLDENYLPNNLLRYRERKSGLYMLLRYPFTRFTRLEFDHMLYQRGQYLSWAPYVEGYELSEEVSLSQDLVYTPGLSLVHDNALYGSTGPLVGWRGLYNVSATLADGRVEYFTNYIDLRSYTLFSRRYAIALRAIAGVSTGKEPQRFNLSGYYGVRAYRDNLSGYKKALLSAELRFPFFEYINLAFPIPLNIPNIRGSLFADLGTVFDNFSDFNATTEDGRLDDLKLGYGFGPRLNLGYVVLRFDIAWQTDLSKTSKPTYYLSLSEDF